MPNPSITRRTRYDVVIAGARAAGAATALLLARAGAKVLVVDPARRGSDTLSTHAIMRGGVLQLHRWGLLDRLRAEGTPTIRRTTFHYPDERFTVDIEPRDGVDGLYAPRRTVLDRTLGDAAAEAGAELAYGVALSGLLWDRSGRVSGATVRRADGETERVSATLVIGADGLHSRVAREVEAPTLRHVADATASVYGYVPGLPDDGYDWYFADACGMGTIPTNGGDACVFASVAPDRFLDERGRGLDALFRDVIAELSPELAARIEALPRPPRLRGFLGAPSHLKQAHGPGWALVGDAGYFKDPLTAHGITDALRDAELLADAVLSGSEDAFAAYQAARDELSIGLMDVTGRVASLAWTTDELKELHLQLSREMSKEVRFMLERSAASAALPDRPAELRGPGRPALRLRDEAGAAT